MGSPRSASAWRDAAMACVIALAAVATTFSSVRPYAGSWNDGSRLATVESLVDRHTWQIDDSIFVHVPPPDGVTPLPYDPARPALVQHGTLDKLLIDGHYYSDKSPVPGLLLAGWYEVWRGMTGHTARSHPDRFCTAMTLASSGLAYVVAVLCIYRLGRFLRLPLTIVLALTGSFALATVALPYARHVNNHILLLGVTAILVLGLAKLGVEMRQGEVSRLRVVGLGLVAGLGYTIDLGAGPVLLVSTALLILLANGRRKPAGVGNVPAALHRPFVCFVLGALPWLVLHHVLNYSIGGTFKPANANPEYFRWPGSPFGAGNLTGSWIHDGPFSFLLYAVSMLAGKRGFLGHNLPLFLALPALWMIGRRCGATRKLVLWAGGSCAGTWLLYAATSNNSSGQCCSIRWFVPLLAPAYFVLALFLKRCPRYRIDFLVLSAWGMLLVLLMGEGPWMVHVVPGFWPIQVAALGSWSLVRYLHRRAALEAATQHPYTTDLAHLSHSGTAALLLWTTARSSSEGHASTTSATSTSTCRATSSSSSPA